MKSVYTEQWTETVVSGHSLKCYSDRVQNKHVLLIRSCYFYVPESEVNDELILCLENGGSEYIIRSKIVENAGEGLASIRDIPIGEGDRICGYAPDSDLGDTLTLEISGELIPLEEWRNYKQ